MSTAIHHVEDNTNSILETMGLRGDLLVEVCRQGLAQYLTATADHPPSAAGTFMYYEMVRSLRQALRPTGWDQDDSALHLILNDELRMAIAVRSGDASTGLPKKNPAFKYPQSTTMHEAIGGNARQLLLADARSGIALFSSPEPPRRIDFGNIRTWWLLHHVDPHHSMMRAELSLPVGFSGNGDVTRWETRIILPAIPFDDEPIIKRADNDSDGVVFDVPVQKKAR